MMGKGKCGDEAMNPIDRNRMYMKILKEHGGIIKRTDKAMSKQGDIMYRVYDTFENCYYTIEEAKKVKKESPTAPPERWLFVAIRDDMPEDIVHEELVVVKSYNPSSELCLQFRRAGIKFAKYMGCQNSAR